jgi:hypothetical protein
LLLLKKELDLLLSAYIITRMDNNPFKEFGGSTFSVKATLIANGTASQRTKNRIREHGDVMTAERFHNDLTCLGGGWAVNFSAPDGWHGWLPVSELSIIRHDVKQATMQQFAGRGWAGDGSGMDDLADFNAMEGMDC